ncbi:hypothetical protein LshimejAT787_0204510 [Lyophyllum shimeji]|uniref:Mediator complex subunit 16 n=1 Tax=Lyophyllum shimeji TaxID=47721 RepID=A0A9P3UL01_LYOSH|nr:hypothetical protein LshimejAT787_0204510 [Lyophyllum shimeji]
MSPRKGKAREKQEWQAGWWDFQPLAERSLRPIEWSPSSVIFSAHPTQPVITARHFSSSKQFLIPSPAPAISSPASYGPPTVISVGPGDDWLFAYFPGRNVDGVGCLWKRGPQIDNWNIKEWWSFAQGAGVVTASWLGTPREWITSDMSGSSTRLPPRGPRTPVSNPTLLLVTQDHHVQVCYLRHYMSSLRFLNCPMTQPGIAVEGQAQVPGDACGIRQCFRAAIGLVYNEQAILIATRSYHTPPPSKDNSRFGAVDSTLPDDMNQPLPPELQSMEWESWGEESTINLYEVQVRHNGVQIAGLTVEPLPPLLNCGGTLVDLKFISTPPSLDVQNSPSSPRKRSNERGQFYIASSYLDFEDYTSPPKSELRVHFIGRQPSPGPNMPKPSWKLHNTCARSFSPRVLTFISPTAIRSDSGQCLIYAGIVDTSGSFPASPSKSKKNSVGNIQVLNLSDLADHEDYEASPIRSDVTRMGQDLPVNAVLSPNGPLLCLVSSSLWPAQTSVQLSPKRKVDRDISGVPVPPFAARLASAVISTRSATDVTHALALASTPITDVLDTLYHAHKFLDGHQNGFSEPHTLELLREAMAVYIERSARIKDTEKDALTARWKTAHDICSLNACNRAFEDCQDSEGYDLDAAWQLIGLAGWVVSFTERVMKQCVLSCDLTTEVVKQESGDDCQPAPPSELSPPLDSPILLHLAHPFALGNFVTALSHVQKYRAYVGSLSARGENSQIARDVLVDLIDSSGVDFAALKSALDPALEEIRAFDRDSCRRALVSCQPTPAMHPHLSKIIQEITQSSILNKPILFIKPHDLVDGVARLNAAAMKDKERDVITKGVLAGVTSTVTCLRCGGESGVVDDFDVGGTVSPRWRAWEKMWTLRCICGGSWSRSK